MTAHDKASRLRELAAKRKGARWEGYANIGDYHQGVYDCDFVSPYTIGACNLNAQVFVLLQDWVSDSTLTQPPNERLRTWGRIENLPTNRNLAKLLRETFGIDLIDTYATNLFPFIKPGGMSARIRQADLDRAAKEFGVPQIVTIAPSVVVCLGLQTCNAIRAAFGCRPFETIAEAIQAPFRVGRTRIWCQAHTGAFGQLNRGKEQVLKDWARMRADVDVDPAHSQVPAWDVREHYVRVFGPPDLTTFLVGANHLNAIAKKLREALRRGKPLSNAELKALDERIALPPGAVR